MEGSLATNDRTRRIHLSLVIAGIAAVVIGLNALIILMR